MADDAHEVLRSLIDHELAVQALYAAFAASLVDDRQFWLVLSGDEQGHADRLEELQGSPDLGLWLTRDVGLRVRAVRSSIDYVESQKRRAQSGEIARLQALVVAKDVEDALIDRLSLLPDPTDCSEISEVLAALRTESQEHRRAIVDALDAERRLRL